MRKWSRIPLSAVCEVFSGFPFKSARFTDDSSQFALVKGENVVQGRIDWAISKYWSREEGEELERYRLSAGDVVLAMDRPWIPAGLKYARIASRDPDSLLVQRVARLRAKDGLSQDYLYFVIGAPDFSAYVQNIGRGVGVPHISGREIGAYEVGLPPVSVQCAIADILSAYDNLIENNRRRMALLEESARQLYQEWFVRLRFPGHEHTRITNGVPEGWERRKLIDLCESVDYGYTASATEEQVGPKFLRITDIVPEFIDWTSVPYCPIEDDRLAKFRLVEGDIVIARTGATVGYAKRLHKRHPEAVFASYLVRLRPRLDVDNLLLGVMVESQAYKDYVKGHCGGAAQPNANAQVLAAAEILLPPSLIQREFRDFVEPLIDQREILSIQNQRLRAARDLLLPRLMSGEVAV